MPYDVTLTLKALDHYSLETDQFEGETECMLNREFDSEDEAREYCRKISRADEPKQSIPEPGELLADPCTPFWAQRLIKELMEKDPVDAANTLAVLAQSFGARAHKMLGGR